MIRMGMFEAFGNAKNTVQGKALAVFISLALALSFINVSAFASEGESDHPDAPVVQAESAADKPAANPEADDAAAGAEEPATATEPETAPSEKAPRIESGSGGGAITESGSSDASIALELQNASIEYLDQRISLPADRVDYPQSREFRFKAFADQGYELESVAMAVDGFETVLEPDGEGFYTIGAPAVASGLTVKVKAAAAEDFSGAESEDPSATPIDSETVIEPEGNAAASGEVGGRAAEGETVAGEEAVAVIADVSSPAFEGYAYVGNIIVKVTAGEGALPEGATVQASEVEREDVAEAVASEVESRGKKLQDMVAIDVTLLDEDGNAIQPETPVNVCFFDANVEGEEVGVYRVSDDASTVEAIGARQADAAIQSFDVDHFSIYVAAGEASQLGRASHRNSLSGNTLTIGNNYASGTTTSLGSWSHAFNVDSGAGFSDEALASDLAEEFIDDLGGGYLFEGAYYGDIQIMRLSVDDWRGALWYSTQDSGYDWKSIPASSVASIAFYYSAADSTNSPSGPSLTLDKSSLTIAVNSTATIKATTVPSGKSVLWSSSNTSVATVSSKGVVTAKGLGTAVVTASMTVNGTRYTASATVNVVRDSQGDTVQNAYFYLWIPGAIEGAQYQDTWLYAGLGQITAPSNLFQYASPNQITNLNGVVTDSGVPDYFKTKKIQYEGHLYTYSASGEGDYTFTVVWDYAVASNGANDGRNWYGENGQNTIIYPSGPNVNCWHVDGHVILNTPEKVTVDFQVQQPGSDGFASTGKPYPATISKGTALSSISIPNQPETKIYNGITYNFDGWYYDQACTKRVDFATGTITDHTVFYARYIAQFVQTISVDGAVVDTQTVEQGGSWVEYEYEAPDGRHIASVSINGVEQKIEEGLTSYTTDALNNVKAGRTIEIVTEADSYAVSYRFASDTAGMTLPAGVTDQLGQASVTSAYKYSTVENEFWAEAYEPVEVTDPDTGALQGTWTFAPGWDKERAYRVAGDVAFTGHWTYTEAEAPIPLPTPTPTDTPAPTPAPAATPAPGVLPADDPVAPIAGALADLAETVIGEDETPLAESNINDDETPLATFDYVHCWVHYYLILGIILTVLYGAGVLIRRIRFTSKLKGYEDDILGIDEGGVAAPSAAPVATEGKEA